MRRSKATRGPLPGIIMALVLVLGACGPAASPSRTTGGVPPQERPRETKTLTVGDITEPQVIMTGIGPRTPEMLRAMVHQHLAFIDDRQQVQPQLAAELPTRDQGTWLVRSDGTMQTTYHIRPNVRWHDGVPLTAQDFVFAWKVTTDSSLEIQSRLASSQISSITAPDDLTLLIEWKRLYANANAITEDDLGPFPAHLLASRYDADKGNFMDLPYWTREFVGVGPYRMVEWVPGSSIRLEAYDDFYTGRAKIDRISIQFIPNPETLAAATLAGAVDLGPRSGTAQSIDQLLFIKQEWERAGQKPSMKTLTGMWKSLFVQNREPVVPELRDIRVRRGLLHAIDRQALSDALTSGLGIVSETLLAPDGDVRWDWVQDVIVHYPYDRSRAEAQFTEAGLRRGSDGVFVTPSGARMAFPQWVNAGATNEQQATIVADMWKTFGVQTEPYILSRVQSQDFKIRAAFPAIFHSGVSNLNPENFETRLHSSQCPREENAFAGQNIGCYANPAMDRITEALKAALEPADQRPLYRELVKLHTENLPMIPLYFQTEITIYREGLIGVERGNWNVAQWDVVRS